MDNPRFYGTPPYEVAVIHGGPGAPGYMAPVARELASDWGILEPLQTAATVDGQLEELRTLLVENAEGPITLIGSSWGAMLGYMLAARHPEVVEKLILVGSGVYEERFATKIQQTRFGRLDEQDKQEARCLAKTLGDPAERDKSGPFARLAALFVKADAYDPTTVDIEVLEHQYHVYQGVWKGALELRRSGGLLELGKQIRCPVVAIHGDYDPHPPGGVKEPLASVLKDFRFILVDNCGHLPWIERAARDRFYAILREELR